MNDIETLIRDSLRYEGDLHALASGPLIRRAHRRQVLRRVGTVAGLGGVAAASFAVAMSSWPQPASQQVATEPTANPTAPPVPDADVTLLKATERVTTPGGAVIIADPDRLCVGNTHEKPSCLIGADPTLDDPSSALGWYTTSHKHDYVYAWLTPETTTEAQLHVGDEASARPAELYRVEGRTMLIAVVTVGDCWAPGTPTRQVGIDSAGEVVYSHSDMDGGTCPGALPSPTRG